MIANHTRAWWQNFSAAGVLVCMASCSSPPKEIEDEGAIQGELAMYVATFDDGTTETNYALRVADGNERRLLFHTAPDIAPGSRLAVWGDAAGDALEVSKFRVVADLETSLPLIGVPPATPRKMCV